MRAPREVAVRKKQEAMSRGEVTYVTGYPCVNGHSSARYCLNNKCVTCAADNYKKHYTKSKAEYKKTAASWAEGNKEKVLLSKRKYRLSEKGKAAASRARVANRLDRNEAERLRRKANPSVRLVSAHKRRAAKIRAVPKWFSEFDAFVMSEAANLVSRRNDMTCERWHIDHIVPMVSSRVCGLHYGQNIRVITATENLSKQNRHWPNMPQDSNTVSNQQTGRGG